MKIIVVCLMFISSMVFAEEIINYENITTIKDTYRNRTHPDFKPYILNYFHALPQNPKRNSFMYKKYKTVPVYFEDSLAEEINLPVSIPLIQVCYFYKDQNMNVLALSKTHWKKLSDKEKDEFFYSSYDSCRFKSTIR